ncbi:MAG TPA: hypothetical protein VF598_05095 [Hymenobacter sp.]|jgi:hypothetical protein
MSFTVEDRRFEIIHASDVSTRDGLGWELWEHVDGNRLILFEIFRHDDLKKMEFSTYERADIPLEALEIVLNDFNTNGGRDFIDYPDEESW